MNSCQLIMEIEKISDREFFLDFFLRLPVAAPGWIEGIGFLSSKATSGSTCILSETSNPETWDKQNPQCEQL